MRLLGPAGLFVCVLALALFPLVLFFFYIVALLLAFGAALCGIATIRARVLPRGGAWLLALGGLPFLAVGLMNILGGSVSLALCNVEQGFDRTLTPSELSCVDRVRSGTGVAADRVCGRLRVGRDLAGVGQESSGTRSLKRAQ